MQNIYRLKTASLARYISSSTLQAALIPGRQYKVRIHYTAYLRDNLKGFYRSVYTDPVTNTTEYVAVTQFQATDARRAFPCFDEPGVKAAYEVCCQ